MKATLTLKNGVQVNFECQASELSTVLAGFDNVSKAVKEEVVNIKTPSFSTTNKKVKKLKQTPWSEKDILGVGNIVYKNLNLNSGISTLVCNYIRKEGDVRNRTEATLYSITSDIKSYLKTGDKSKTSTKIRSVLDAHGIFPSQMIRSNYDVREA